MTDNDTTTGEASPRREYLRHGGAVIGGGLLAGCTGETDAGVDVSPQAEIVNPLRGLIHSRRDRRAVLSCDLASLTRVDDRLSITYL